MPYIPGALINAVGRGTPAAAAGLRPNDVVVEFAGKTIDSHRRLLAAVALLRPGEKAKIVVSDRAAHRGDGDAGRAGRRRGR